MRELKSALKMLAKREILMNSKKQSLIDLAQLYIKVIFKCK